MEQHCCYKKRAYVCISIQELKTYQVVPEEGGRIDNTKKRKTNRGDANASKEGIVEPNAKLVEANMKLMESNTKLVESNMKLMDIVMGLLDRSPQGGPDGPSQTLKPHFSASAPPSPKKSEYYFLMEGTATRKGLTGHLLRSCHR